MLLNRRSTNGRSEWGKMITAVHHCGSETQIHEYENQNQSDGCGELTSTQKN